MEDRPPTPRISYASVSYNSANLAPAQEEPPTPPSSLASSEPNAYKPFILSLAFLALLALALWVARFEQVLAVVIVVFFGLPICGFIWIVWLMTGKIIRQHWRAFLWGLMLGTFPLLFALALVIWWTDFFGSSDLTFSLVFTFIPLCDLIAVGALSVIKTTRWFGFGLVAGLLLYTLFYGVSLILLLAEI